jgi:Leucine-rich repeat (LRR) protein
MLLRQLLCVLCITAFLQGAIDPEWIRKLGGKIEQDSAGNIVAVNLSATWVNDTEILELAALPKLERLDLSHTRISDEGLLHLRTARQIRDLNLLYAEQITDLGLSAIKNWTHLKRLNVRGTRISDPTLAIVGKLTQLESLDIANTGVTDAGLDSLVPLTHLKHLALGRSRFSDNAIVVLRLLSTLESLDLSGPRGVTRNQRSESGVVPEALVQAISELKGLTALKLGHNQIGADELRILAGSLGKLEKLGLEASSKVDDQVLKVLVPWKSLKYVDVQETKVTQDGIQDLKKQRPDLVILSGPFAPPVPKT